MLQSIRAHLSRSSSESTLMTPREAAPELGLSTAGKPTTLLALSKCDAEVTAIFLGVGRPFSFITSRVLYRGSKGVRACDVLILHVIRGAAWLPVKFQCHVNTLDKAMRTSIPFNCITLTDTQDQLLS